MNVFEEPSLANFFISDELTIEQQLDGEVFQKELVEEEWSLIVEGASNMQGAGIGIVLVTLDVSTIEATVKLDFHASNYKAKYEVLIFGMLMVLRVKRMCLQWFKAHSILDEW